MNLNMRSQDCQSGRATDSVTSTSPCRTPHRRNDRCTGSGAMLGCAILNAQQQI